MHLSALFRKAHSFFLRGLTFAPQVHLTPERCSSTWGMGEGWQRESLERTVPFALQLCLPRRWERCQEPEASNTATSVAPCTKVAQSIAGDSWLVLHKSVAETVLHFMAGLSGDLSTLSKIGNDETLVRSIWTFLRTHIYQMTLQTSFKFSVSFLLTSIHHISKNYMCSSNQGARNEKFYLISNSYMLRHPNYRHYHQSQNLSFDEVKSSFISRLGNKRDTTHSNVSNPPSFLLVRDMCHPSLSQMVPLLKDNVMLQRAITVWADPSHRGENNMCVY